MSTRRDGTLAARALHALNEAPGGVLPTTDMAHLFEKPWRWDDPAVARQRALSRAGNVLREMEVSGEVERAGVIRGHWQQAAVQKWRITPQGRNLIDYWRDEPARASRRRELMVLRRERRAEAGRLLAEAKATWAGRKIPIDERRRVSQELRSAGCTLRSIAEVLGVTPELIRRDTLPLLPQYRQQRPRRDRAPVVRMRRKQGRWPRQVSAMNKDGPLAGLFTVTFTEW